MTLFAADVGRVVKAKLAQLRPPAAGAPAASRGASQARGASAAVQQHINSKFVMDGAFVGAFATLDDFYKGPEARIGAPNPRIMEGMKNEHCERDNADTEFRTSNYNLRTVPRIEWEFVVDPKPNVAYEHTPRDKKDWPRDKGWYGEHGRVQKTLNELLAEPQVQLQIKKAGLTREEVIAVRLYTGPMFVLVKEPCTLSCELNFHVVLDSLGRDFSLLLLTRAPPPTHIHSTTRCCAGSRSATSNAYAATGAQPPASSLRAPWPRSPASPALRRPSACQNVCGQCKCVSSAIATLARIF